MTGNAAPEDPARHQPRGLDDVRVPDAIAPIVAYRTWAADTDGRLRSPMTGEPWAPRQWMVARCPRAGHPAPRENCTCGLYARKELYAFPPVVGCLYQAIEERGPTAGASHTLSAEEPDYPVPLFGKVELAGKVIEHDGGYRAERARLVEILPTEGLYRRAEAVSNRYGVPIGKETSPLTQNAHRPGFPFGSLWTLAWSGFFAVNAVRGILMSHGPHRSEWWLWLIAIPSALVALCAFILFALGMSELWLAVSAKRRVLSRLAPRLGVLFVLSISLSCLYNGMLDIFWNTNRLGWSDGWLWAIVFGGAIVSPIAFMSLRRLIRDPSMPRHDPAAEHAAALRARLLPRP